MKTLKDQIEFAFEFRGNVTLNLLDGRTVEGFVFNREFQNPRLSKDMFVEIFRADNGQAETLRIQDLKSIDVTGEDCAAGKSYAEWIEKQKLKKAV